MPTHHKGLVLKSEKSNRLTGASHLQNQNTLFKSIPYDGLEDGDKLSQHQANHLDSGLLWSRANKLLLFVQNKATLTSVLDVNNHKFPHLFILFHSWKYLSF
ncbi:MULTISPECIES: hypothetical protein [unclassified Arcicella]|uniref:hypothetical protein n=1 Tax=unclassified Arcicella TaxID=2644986 RepID=UPI002865DDB9|nr:MULTISPECIES: hypothetical protein [unclassified Arcicella]MDR6561893.1 hypothetical protein [Arcicella sp. BE51]MDR6814039.1 hypothetical protein [Arcicella sp. BE140]